MKYIRTKHNIYEIEGDYIDVTNRHYYVVAGGYREFEEKEIDKQADNIEDLCDEFVLVVPWLPGNPSLLGKPNHRISKKGLATSIKRAVKGHYSLYGAIWTAKGLKFVAKIYYKGEWGLL